MSDWRATLPNVPGLEFWNAATGGSQLTPDADGNLIDDPLPYDGQFTQVVYVSLDWTTTTAAASVSQIAFTVDWSDPGIGPASEFTPAADPAPSATAAVTKNVAVAVPVTLVISQPTMSQPGVGAPWNASFNIAPNENGYLIQKVTTDWSYYMQSPVGPQFLGSSTATEAMTKKLPDKYPLPYQTTDDRMNSPLVYWEVWYVHNSKVYAHSNDWNNGVARIANSADIFEPSPPLFSLNQSNYYQAGEVRWVPDDKLPTNGLQNFFQVPHGTGPTHSLLMATTEPPAWKVGDVVASRSWGYYYKPGAPARAFKKVDVLGDGGTGWTVTGTYKIVSN